MKGLIGQAIEGYARGINPQYAAQQDAQEQADLLAQIQQELGPSMGHHPYNLAMGLIKTGNPQLVEQGKRMLQEYHTGKTAEVKNHEYGMWLPPDEWMMFMSGRGQGWKPIGEPKEVYQNGRPMLAVVMTNQATGEVKTIVTDAQAFKDPVKVSAGGGVEAMYDPNKRFGSGGASPLQAQGEPQGGVQAQGNTTLPGTLQSPGNGAPGASSVPPQAAPPAYPAGSPLEGYGDSPSPSASGAFYPVPRNEQLANITSDVIAKGRGERQLEWEANRTPDRKKLVNIIETGKVINDVGLAVGEKLKTGKGTVAGFLYGINPNLKGFRVSGGSELEDVRAYLNTITSELAFGKMEELRSQSAQGATGLGPIAIKEFEALQQSIANLDQAQSWDQLYNNVNKIMERYDRLIKKLKYAYAEKYPDDIPKLQSELENIDLGNFEIKTLPELNKEKPSLLDQLKARDNPVTTGIKQLIDSELTMRQGLEDDGILKWVNRAGTSIDQALEDFVNIFKPQNERTMHDYAHQQAVRELIKREDIVSPAVRKQIEQLPLDQLIELLEQSRQSANN